MSREEIIECLNHSKNGENNRKLVNFCKEPKKFNEINKSGIKGDVFKILVDLKTIGAIDFADGKYFSTPEALDVLNTLTT